MIVHKLTDVFTSQITQVSKTVFLFILIEKIFEFFFVNNLNLKNSLFILLKKLFKFKK